MSDEPVDPKGSPWWKRLWVKKEHDALEREGLGLRDKSLQVHSEVQEWQKALEQLQPKIRKMRTDIDGLTIQELTFDVLGAGTFLLQIDLLLIKIRQHYTNYDRRRVELNQKIPSIKEMLDTVELKCLKTFDLINRLNNLLEERTFRQLNAPEVIELVRLMETQTKGLTDSMHTMNEMALKRDPLYQLFEAELFKTLVDLERTGKETSMTSTLLMSTTSLPYRDKAQNTSDPDLKKIAFQFINLFENLKRTSILYHNPLVVESMIRFKKSIELFIDLSQSSGAVIDVIPAIHDIYHCLESMRFTPLKGFRDKAKYTQKQLCSCLDQSDIGRESLKMLRISPRDRLKLKSKFR